jgi:hypothetical protein
VNTVPTTNAALDENGSKHRWPQSHCNSAGIPSAGETTLLEIIPQVRQEIVTAIIQRSTSLAMNATEGDVPGVFLTCFEQEPTPFTADVWILATMLETSSACASVITLQATKEFIKL